MTNLGRTGGRRASAWTATVAAAAVCIVGVRLSAQTRLSDSIYRVARDDSAAATQTAAAPQAQAAAPSSPAPPAAAFDFAQQPGEHPLAPIIRVCKACLDHVDRDIPTYSCTLVKRERLQGELGDPQTIDLKVRNSPFSVYMSFVKPHTGREVLFVDGQNQNDLIVREAGLLGFAGKINLDPQSTTAMSEQKYPITRVGIRNLLAELIQHFQSDTKYTESEVAVNPKAELNKRPATLVQVTHPVPRQNFRSHIARIYFDNELHVPIYYDAYMWPGQEGEQPPLEESYWYTNLKVNAGLTARDFDAEGGVIFK